MHWNSNTGTGQQFVLLHDNQMLLMVTMVSKAMMLMIMMCSHGRHSLPARNCVYLTYQYNCPKHLLRVPLYPSNAIISQSQAYAISISKSKAVEYFKSIHHLYILRAFAMTSSSDKTNELSNNLSVQGKRVSPSVRGRTGCVIKLLEAQVGQLQGSGAGPFSCKNKTTLVTSPRRFSFKPSSNCTSRNE